MKKILSYLFPITKKIKSDNSGIVELTYYNGKRILDTANANYSYGTAERIQKFGLGKIDFSKIDNVLLLGLGAGSVIQTLRKDFKFQNKIVAVELDKVIVDLALNEFNLSSDVHLEVHQADAAGYIKSNRSKSDLIIIDLFIDNEVPGIFYSKDFWTDIYNITNENGYVVFNAGFIEKNHAGLARFQEMIHELYVVKKYEKIEGDNIVYVGEKIKMPY